ncbi:hypothetical protein pb186bvf_008906 [Paramecium bursaria]
MVFINIIILVPQNIVKSKSYQNKKDFSSLGAYAILDKNDGGYDLYYSDISLTATPELKNKVHILDQDPNANCHDFVFITKNQFAVSCAIFDDVNNVYSLQIVTTEGDQVKLQYQFQTTKQYAYAESTIIDYDEKYLYLGVNSYNSVDKSYDIASVIHVLDLVKINQIEVTNLDITAAYVKGINNYDFSLTNIQVGKDIVTFSSYNVVFQSQTVYKLKLKDQAWQKYNLGFETLIYTNYKGYQIGYRFDYKSSTISFFLIGVYQQMVAIFQEGQRQIQININQIFNAPIIKLTSKYLVVLDTKKIYTIDLKNQRTYVKFIDLITDNPLTIETDYYRNLLIIYYPLSVGLFQVDQQLLTANPTKPTTTEQQFTITFGGIQKTINYNVYDKTDYKVYLGKGLIQNPIYLLFNTKKTSFTYDSTQVSGQNINLNTFVQNNQMQKVLIIKLLNSSNAYIINQFSSLELEAQICQFSNYNNELFFDCFNYTNANFLKAQQSVKVKVIPNQQYNLPSTSFLLINEQIEIYQNWAYNGTIEVGQQVIQDFLFSNQLIILLEQSQIQIYDSKTLSLIININQASLTLQGYTSSFKPKAIFANSNFNGQLFIHNDDDILIGEISNQFSLIQTIKIPIQYVSLKISISKQIIVYIFDENKHLMIYNLIQNLGQFQLITGLTYDQFTFDATSYAINYQNGEVGILAQKNNQQYIACFRQQQQIRDYLGKLIPVPREVSFIQMGFSQDNSLIYYQIKDKSYLIKRFSQSQLIELTIINPLDKFTQKVDIQYQFSNEYNNATSKQSAIVEYGYFLYTDKPNQQFDVRIQSTTKIPIKYNAYSSDFYMSNRAQEKVHFVVPTKQVSQKQVDQIQNCIVNNGNLICASQDKILQYSNEGVLLNSLTITNQVKIMVSRDDDKYVIVYDEALTLTLLQTTQKSILKIGEVILQENINNIIYYQNYLVLYTSSLNIQKVEILENLITLTDQGIQIQDDINNLVYQKASNSIFYSLKQLDIIKQVVVDLNTEAIPLDIQAVSFKIQDILNANQIYYLNMQLSGLYATKQNIYINSNYGQVIKLKFSQNSFQVQNILVAGKDTSDLTYVVETSNFTIIGFNRNGVIRIYSNQKVENNVILSIQKLQSQIIPLVYETDNLDLTYINYYDSSIKQFLINTLSDDVYLDCFDLTELKRDYYYPGVSNDGDSIYFDYKIQLYRARDFNASPWIISLVVGVLILGGYAFYFLKLKSKQIPVESEPLTI